MDEIKKYQPIINNLEVEAKEYIEIVSPLDLKVFALIGKINKDSINNLMDLAKRSQKNWKQYNLNQRIIKLNKLVELIERDQNEITQLIQMSIAKNYNDALNEVKRSIIYCKETFACAKRLNPKTYQCSNWENSHKLAFYKHEPKGVVLAISPFNYPLNLALSKIMPALVMGNSVVWKPATQSLLIAWKIIKLAQEANLDEGIFNVVFNSGSEIGDFLISHKKIDTILFTGSTFIGEKIKKLSKSKDFVLEMGGKDFAIVLNDTNFEKTAQEIINGAFGYNGQRCTAIKGVITYEYNADQLILALQKELNEVLSKNKNFITPLIDMKALKFAQKLINDALLKKATLICGNKVKNNYLEPTILDRVNLNMMIASNEQFAPILPIFRVENKKEIIDIVNDLKYGLQAAIFSSNYIEALNLGKLLNVARININCKPQRGPDILPFSGFKSSGFNNQGLNEALKSVTKLKGFIINLTN